MKRRNTRNWRIVGILILLMAWLCYGAQDKQQESYASIHDKARKGDVAAVKALLEKGVDVNLKNQYGNTPLHYAAASGHLGIARLLITKGADLGAKDHEGWTPLHYAVNNGYKDMAELLMDEGADVNAKDIKGEIPLSIAESKGHVEIAGLIRKKGKKKSSTTDVSGAVRNQNVTLRMPDPTVPCPSPATAFPDLKGCPGDVIMVIAGDGHNFPSGILDEDGKVIGICAPFLMLGHNTNRAQIRVRLQFVMLAGEDDRLIVDGAIVTSKIVDESGKVEEEVHASVLGKNPNTGEHSVVYFADGRIHLDGFVVWHPAAAEEYSYYETKARITNSGLASDGTVSRIGRGDFIHLQLRYPSCR